MIVSDKYSGNIGESGNPLIINVNGANGTTSIKSQGQVWLKGSHRKIAARKQNRAVFNFGGTVLDQMSVTRGRVIISNGAIVPILYVGYVSNMNGDVSLHVETEVNTAQTPSLFANGGVIMTHSAWSLYQFANANADIMDGNHASSIVRLISGVLRCNAEGSYQSVQAMGGLMDFSQDGRAKTIDDSQLWTPATLNLDNGAGNVVVTNLLRVGHGNVIGSFGQVQNTVDV